ncbi:MAG: hypothetical protein IJ334_07110, partial [Clostridia bacterium]|nr:hypothetical protein [Clostridia bacterium]
MRGLIRQRQISCFPTDRTMSGLMGEAFEQYYADGTVRFNEFMRFRVTLKNGDTIPLTVVGVGKGGAHSSESMYYFDRTITEDAVLFAMECFLPEGVELSRANTVLEGKVHLKDVAAEIVAYGGTEIVVNDAPENMEG